MVERQSPGWAEQDGELLRLLVENVQDYAIFVVDTDGLVQTWSSGAERLLGYEVEDILGKPVDILFTPEDVRSGAPQQEMHEARTTGRGVDDRWHVRKDGSQLWSSGVMTPLWDESGVLRGFAKIMRDRTDWKISEDARQESEANQAAVLETALDGIITIDHLDHVLEFNPAAEKLFGYSREQVLGRKMAELIIPPHMRERHYQGMEHYLRTGEGPALGKRLQLPAMRCDGTEFPAELAIVRVPGEGSPRFTGYIRDISEREMQERRRAAQLAVTEILAEAASVRDAASRIVQAICVSLDWDLGGFWLVDPQAQVLRCLDMWRREQVPAEKFEQASREQVFERGQGLPGRVWSSSEPLWLEDVTVDANFSRLHLTLEAGLHGAFAVPILLGSKVLGVAEFFSRSWREPDTDLLGMMASIGGHIGQFIERTESQERLKTLIDNLPHGAIYQAAQPTSGEPNTRFTYLSAGVERIFGIKAEEALADPNVLYNTVYEEDRDRLRAAEVAAYRTLSPFDCTFRHHAASGEIRWVHCRSAPRDLATGEFAWEGVILDVTDRQRAEQAQRASENLLRFTLDATQVGHWDLDLVSDTSRRSLRHDQIFGYDTPVFEWGYAAFQKHVHPEDRAEVDRQFAQAKAGKDWEFECRILRADGVLRWIWAKGSVFTVDGGTPQRMAGLVMDITDRKRLEQDLRFLAEASRSLASLVDYQSTLQRMASLAVPVFADWCVIHIADEQGALRPLAIAHADPSKVEMAGVLWTRYPPDANAPVGAGHVFRTQTSERVANVSEPLLESVAKDEQHLRMLRDLRLKSYICVPLSVREKALGAVTFMASESGRHYTDADLAIAQDLAYRAAVAVENAQLYAELREAGRRKDDFLAMLAHELRNPLAPIRSGLDLLGMLGTDATILDPMQRQVEHLVRLVDDLLDVSRIMRGKAELRKENVELSSVIERAIDTVRPMIAADQQTLHVSPPAEPLWLHADPVRLAQVVSNLLNNASKYTQQAGQIWLTVEQRESEVVIQVRDSGIGIEAELLPRVFDLFTQSTQTLERAQGGLGIGLTVVKSLVEMHDGTVTVQSLGRGRGSEFTVRLPITVREVQQPVEENPLESTPGYRILIVDDNVAAAKMLAMLLSKLGAHQVFTAYDGPAALKAAKEHRPHLLLLDIGLPKMDGYEVARRLREQAEFEHMLIVALTGYGTEEDRRKSLEAGFDEHVVKPPGIEALHQLLAHPKLPKT